MKGVQFVVDSEAEKTAVVIDLKKHRDLWEDFYDHAIAKARATEPREPLAALRRRLVRQGKLGRDG